MIVSIIKCVFYSAIIIILSVGGFKLGARYANRDFTIMQQCIAAGETTKQCIIQNKWPYNRFTK